MGSFLGDSECGESVSFVRHIVRSVASTCRCRRNPGRVLFAFGCRHTDVVALNGGRGGTETKTDILVPSAAVLARSGRLGLNLGVLEDVRLLLESALRLNGQLGGPVRNIELVFMIRSVRTISAV